MTDVAYLVARAEQELRAAALASDGRAKDIHLQLADAYSFRIREMRAIERRSDMRIVESA